LFAHLRPDEIGRIVRHFETITLPPGGSHNLAATTEAARCLVVISGLVELRVEDPTGELEARMSPGDRYGAAALLAGHPRQVRITARRRALLVLLDRPGLEAILAEYPAIALPLAAELASELRAKNDQVRQILELRETGVSRKQLEDALKYRRRLLAMQGAGVRRSSIAALFHRVVVERGAEPPFWMLIGFLSALAGARLVVFFILKYRLEKHFFALVAGPDPNPVHIHHFNYGLVLVGLVGIAALLPQARRRLRLLALLFGIGCGLVFDEFALFWNLNPDYSQGLSLISAGIVAVLLVQLTYFRGFWLALTRQIADRLGGD
jgi:CRP-like cAMP-binding protein